MARYLYTYTRCPAALAVIRPLRARNNRARQLLHSCPTRSFGGDGRPHRHRLGRHKVVESMCGVCKGCQQGGTII